MSFETNINSGTGFLPFLPRLSGALDRVEQWMINLAAIGMLVVMGVVVADVLLRYLVARPLIFAYDLISMYLIVIVFFFSLPGTLQRHGHVAIDFFQPWLPARVRFAGEALGYAAATIVLGLIAWRLGLRCATALSQHEVTATTIQWPIWLSYLPATIGSALMTLRCLYRALAHAVSAWSGTARVELPPPHEGTTGTMAE